MKRGRLQFYFIAMLIVTGVHVKAVASDVKASEVLKLAVSALLALYFGLQLRFRKCSYPAQAILLEHEEAPMALSPVTQIILWAVTVLVLVGVVYLVTRR